MNHKQHKPYCNAYRNHERPYMRMMLLHGVGVDEAQKRLCDVNMRLKVPIRSRNILRTLAPGARKAFRDYEALVIAELAIYKKYTKTEICKLFSKDPQTVIHNVNRYKAGKLDYLTEYYPSLRIRRHRQIAYTKP